jgi:transcriptional regulator GlxA family with amidase domain
VTRVVFLLARALHLLDLAGPTQVFSTVSDFGFGYEMHYVGEQEDVPSHQGVTLRAATSWPELAPDDLIFIPGWRTPRVAANAPFSASTLARLVAHSHAGGTVASVCSGAFALGQAGLLENRRCTTHHDLTDELARRYPSASVIRDVLYVMDRGVVSSAGIASGVDLALHFVAVRHGPEIAAQVAREMVVYARRNGDEAQASAMLRYRSHVNDAVHRVQDMIDSRFHDRLPLASMAGAVGVSERTLTRRFAEATGLTPLRYQQVLRVERADHLIGHGATMEAAARAVGFEDARMLRRLRAAALTLTSTSTSTSTRALPDAYGGNP